MKTRKWAGALLSAAAVSAAAAGPGEAGVWAAANNAFGLDLYARLRETPGNVFISPYSLSSALGMTLAGARGATAEEMAHVLHAEPSSEGFHACAAALRRRLTEIENRGAVTLRMANSLWPQAGHPFLSSFLDLLKNFYHAVVTPLDFASAAEEARQRINTWAEEQTAGKIQNLIPEGALDALARLVLVNAIYFKGRWAAQFDPEATEPARFLVSEEESVTVPMMHRVGEAGYGETPQAQIVELPYEGGDLSMVVILPRHPEDLQKVEHELPARLSAALDELRQREVEIFLPRFRITGRYDLERTLAEMGMRAAFAYGKADFSGMDGSRELAISRVIHQAFIEVSEEGTEAAATSAVVMRLTAAPLVRPVFRADRPFLFLIRERSTGAILFVGRVVDPTTSS